MRYHAILLIALAAFAVPAAASATSIELDGKAVSLAARGPVRGELTAAGDVRPVLIRGKARFVRVTDLGGDLKVRCNGRSAQRKNDEGQTVFVCAGRGLLMAIRGGHFRLNALAVKLQIRIPDGYSGLIGGNVHEWTGADASAGAGQSPERTAGRDQPVRDKPAGERQQPRPAPAPAPTPVPALAVEPAATNG